MNLTGRIVLVFFCLIASFNLYADNNTAIIKGRLIGSDALPDNDTYIGIESIEIFKSVKNQVRILSNGEFEYYTLVKEPKEFIINFNNQNLSVILQAGDSIFVEIDASKITTTSGVRDYVRVTGKTLFPNELILKYTPWIGGMKGAQQTLLGAKLNDKEFKQQSLEQRELSRHEISDILKRDGVNNPLFAEWINSEIDYTSGYYLCFNPFLGKVNESLADTSSYFNFVNTIKPGNSKFNFTESYFNYIKSLELDVEVVVNISKSFATRRGAARKLDSLSRTKYLQLYMDFINLVTRESERQDIYAYLLYQHSQRAMHLDNHQMEMIAKYVPQDLMQRVRLLTDVKTLNLDMCIDSFNASESTKNAIRNLFANGKGKTIYIDISAKGCGPCIRELPHYNDLIKDLGANVHFLFLGASFKETEWSALLTKYNLKGDHHLLNDALLAFFSQCFDVSSYPYHALITPTGRMIISKVPGVGDGTNTNAVAAFIRTFDDSK